MVKKHAEISTQVKRAALSLLEGSRIHAFNSSTRKQNIIKNENENKKIKICMSMTGSNKPSVPYSCCKADENLELCVNSPGLIPKEGPPATEASKQNPRLFTTVSLSVCLSVCPSVC